MRKIRSLASCSRSETAQSSERLSSRTGFLSTEVTRALTQKVDKLIANDRFLAYVTDASCDDVYLREAIGVNANYCKIVPLPMSLERIKRRLKGRYYRQIDA